MTMIDLGPAAARVAALLDGVGDLDLPTPSTDRSVGELLDHLDGLSTAFVSAAAKDVAAGSHAPDPDAAALDPQWRTSLPRHLEELVVAWRDPEAWTGMTRAGGVDLPGEIAGIVALDELVLHGWDLARATGQDYQVDDESVAACHGFVSQFSAPGQEADREGLFGPVVDVPEPAPLFDRVLGMSGRDPSWAPPG
jgi:uncharacterized protein (TIGR03086 family)